MPKKRKSSHQAVRISDVAALAKVSIATVSRSLSDPERVSAKTRERVLQAIRTTGYTPNLAARALRGVSSRMVLVVVPSLITPFFSELLLRIDRALSEHGYGLLIGNLDDHIDKASRLADLAHGGQISGALLLNGRILRGKSGSLGDGAIPCVALNRPFETTITSVMLDDGGAIVLVADHLIGLGHRRFGYVGGEAGNPVETERWSAFRARIRAAGLPPPWHFDGDFHITSGMAAARAFLTLSPRPTAVVCSSDEMAIGFISVVRTAGLTVPEQVSVTGFDGIAFAEHVDPKLTTVVQPQQAMADAAVRQLLRLIEGESDIRSLRFQGELRIGGSSGPSPA